MGSDGHRHHHHHHQQGSYGPPPPQGYGPPGGGYGYGGPPPPGPPQGGGGGWGRPPNQYAPPQRPPPQGYDAYGYPQQQQQRGGGYAYNARSGPPPPERPQHFGSGAPQGYTFQYSKCTGTRKALLIGINYIGQKAQLRGCINDVHNVSAFLSQHYNYKREDMVILTDDARNPISQPTKANIFRAFEWLIKDAQPHDSLFLHYSGEWL